MQAKIDARTLELLEEQAQSWPAMVEENRRIADRVRNDDVRDDSEVDEDYAIECEREAEVIEWGSKMLVRCLESCRKQATEECLNPPTVDDSDIPF